MSRFSPYTWEQIALATGKQLKSLLLCFFHNLLFSFLLGIPFYWLTVYQCLIDAVTSIQVCFPKFWAIFLVKCKVKCAKCFWGCKRFGLAFLISQSFAVMLLSDCVSGVCVASHSHVAWILMSLIIPTYMIISVVLLSQNVYCLHCWC